MAHPPRAAQPTRVVDLRRWKDGNVERDALALYQQGFAQLPRSREAGADATAHLATFHDYVNIGYERYMCIERARRRKKSKLSMEAQLAVRQRNILHSRACKLDKHLERQPWRALTPKEQRPHWREWKEQVHVARQLVKRDKIKRARELVSKLDVAGKANGGNGEAWNLMRELEREVHVKPTPRIQLKDAQGRPIVDCVDAMRAHFERMTNRPAPDGVPPTRPVPKPMPRHMDELPPTKRVHLAKEQEQVVTAALGTAGHDEGGSADD